ncbi:hypothetical protein ACFFGT_15355 [Mucilaginibacter angelicae]|uniref:Uncharacterized protein n=1 Tax=Mucilaginibacter angelicae TaxID=869718 RepID=A0ABV6L833_9SPHI
MAFFTGINKYILNIKKCIDAQGLYGNIWLIPNYDELFKNDIYCRDT